MKIIPHPPYKVEKDRFRSLTNSIIAKKLVSTNLGRFLRGIKSPKPWVFRLPFKVYGAAVITLKKEMK